MRTKLLLLSDRLQVLLVEQKYSGLGFSIHVMMSTYTSGFVTKEIWKFLHVVKGKPYAAVM